MVTYNIKTAELDNEVIEKINEVFHDIEAEAYTKGHPEIFDYEKESWGKLFNKVRLEKTNTKPLTVLDVGTGTGFVPLSISPYLSQVDKVIATDISKQMLRQSEEELKDSLFQKEFVQVDGEYRQIKTSSVDIVTMNSVLHHVANVEKLFSELERILVPGGSIIIKHEPNIRFVKNILLRFIYLSLKKIRDIKQGAVIEVEDPMCKKVVKELNKKGIEFEHSLSRQDLQSLVDIHSPTAGGGMVTDRGFDPYCLVSKYFRSSSLVECRTYGYLGKIRDDSTLPRRVFSKILKALFPKNGYFFDVIIRKQND